MARSTIRCLGLALLLLLLLPAASAWAGVTPIPLPEPSGALGSTARDIHRSSRRASMRMAGHAVDPGGSEKAALWRAPSVAGPFALQDVEDPLPSGSSRIEGVGCSKGVCSAVGSSGDPGARLPVVWHELNDPTCGWCVDTSLVSPPSMIEGLLRARATHERAGSPPDLVALGEAVIANGTPGGVRKGAVWVYDGSTWSASTLPDPQSEVGDWETSAHGGLWVVSRSSGFYVGSATSPTGVQHALIWSHAADAAVATPLELPLPVGGSGGGGRVVVESGAGLYAAGTVTAGATGESAAFLWGCPSGSCASVQQWSPMGELSPPSGLGDCVPEGMGDVVLTPNHETLDVVGACTDALGASIGVI